MTTSKGSNSLQNSKPAKVALVTGAAQRIGANIASALHASGYRVILHYRNSQRAAKILERELNTARPESAHSIAAELSELDDLALLVEQALSIFGQLDVLINNASSFYPTPPPSSTLNKHERLDLELQWTELLDCNLKAPYFLSQLAFQALKKARGTIINVIDIHADRPLKGYPIYSISKAGLSMLTKSLAIEWAPEIRVNGVAPGAILWPEQDAELDSSQQAELLEKIPMGKLGCSVDIANAVIFLVDADYITGQIIAVDGGRSLSG